MRAGFTDPDGPRLSRAAPYAVPILGLLFAIYGPVTGTPATLLSLGSFALFNLVGVVGTRQRRPRTAELVCGHGYVDVKQSGSRNQRILARAITGATTARTSSGVVLTLQREGRSRPITIEVSSEPDAEKVRSALGIGHGGFGTITWRTRSPKQRSATVARLIATSAFALTLVCGGLSASAWAFLGAVAFIATLVGLTGHLSSPDWPTVVMSAEGLRLLTRRGWFALPYRDVQDLAAERTALSFTVPQPFTRVIVEGDSFSMGGLSEHEQQILASQVTAAAQRARGLGPDKRDATGRVDVLRRATESPRDWLVRLDMAGQLLASGSGYRGNTIDAEDLWTVLEDPEAEPNLRVAAARVLRHLPAPETRVRIAAAVAAVRDDSTSRRLRVAVRDDLDTASQELAYLDAAEARASMAMPPMHVRPTHGR